MLKRILATGAVVLSLAGTGAMAGSAKAAPKAAAKAPIICPVMGTKIASPAKAAGKSVYKGKTYYFCCPGCKPMFDASPQKYVGKKK